MADNTPKTDAKGDGATDTPVPNAAAEPAKQAVAETAKSTPAPASPTANVGSSTPSSSSASSTSSVRPPAPADYKMPDDYATEGTFDKVKSWAEANPGLAVLAAAGIGIVAGRILTGLVPDPEPPSLSERVEAKAKTLKKQARKQGKVVRKEASVLASDTGESLADALERATVAIREAAGNAGDYAEEGVERTRDFAETLSEAISDIVSTKIDDWVDRVRK